VFHKSGGVAKLLPPSLPRNRTLCLWRHDLRTCMQLTLYGCPHPVTHATLTSASMSTPSNGEANATPSASSGKVRVACNRCHAQKLRCVKRENQMKCERCNRLNTSCRFSPRAPRSSLKQREPAVDGVQGLPPLSQTTDTSNVHLDSILGDYQNEWMAPEDLTTDLTNTSGMLHRVTLVAIFNNSY
jgi:hypothetical protein